MNKHVYQLAVLDDVNDVSLTDVEAQAILTWLRTFLPTKLQQLQHEHPDHHYRFVDQPSYCALEVTYDPSDDVDDEESWYGIAYITTATIASVPDEEVLDILVRFKAVVEELNVVSHCVELTDLI